MTTISRITEQDKEVGRRIREVRLHDGFSLMELSKVLGVTWQMVQKYEMGKTRIPLVTLQNLSLFLEVPLGWFLGTEDFHFGPSRAKPHGGRPRKSS